MQNRESPDDFLNKKLIIPLKTRRPYGHETKAALKKDEEEEEEEKKLSGEITDGGDDNEITLAFSDEKF